MHDLRASAQGGAALRELSVVNHIYISMGDETTCFTQLQKSTGVKKKRKEKADTGRPDSRGKWGEAQARVKPSAVLDFGLGPKECYLGSRWTAARARRPTRVCPSVARCASVPSPPDSPRSA